LQAGSNTSSTTDEMEFKGIKNKRTEVVQLDKHTLVLYFDFLMKIYMSSTYFNETIIINDKICALLNSLSTTP
jgi:hypothetical protein